MARRSVVFVDTWRHRAPDEMNNYVAMAAAGSDVVCLSEVTHLVTVHDFPALMYNGQNGAEPPAHLNGLWQLQSVLGPNFLVRYATTHFSTQTCASGREYPGVGIGGALVHHRALPVVGYGHYMIELRSAVVPNPILQWIVYEIKFVRYLVAHLYHTSFTSGSFRNHDLGNGLSRMVRSRLADVRVAFNVQRTVLGGGLGVMMDAEALRMLEEPASDGVVLVNQVRRRKVLGRRTRLHQEFGRPGSEHSACVFVSAGVTVQALAIDGFFAGSPQVPLDVLYF